MTANKRICDDINTAQASPANHNPMASFFDLKARKQAAASGASSKNDKQATQTPRAQPWVEK
jgi:hypothetical protein